MNWFRKQSKAIDYEALANEKRKEFEWQTKGKDMPPFYLYPFCENGLTVLVTKYDGNTKGIGWYIIDDFTEDGKFKRADVGFYNYGAGVEMGKKETDEVYARVKALNMVTETVKVYEAHIRGEDKETHKQRRKEYEKKHGNK